MARAGSVGGILEERDDALHGRCAGSRICKVLRREQMREQDRTGQDRTVKDRTGGEHLGSGGGKGIVRRLDQSQSTPRQPCWIVVHPAKF